MPDERLNRIESKIDKLSDHLGSIDQTLAAQHISLAEHIRRTGILESQVKPIEKHVAMVNGALKLVGLAGVVAGIIEVILLAKGK